MWNLIIYSGRLGLDESRAKEVFERFPYAHDYLAQNGLLSLPAGDYEDTVEMLARIDSFYKHLPTSEINPVIVGNDVGSIRYPFFGPVPRGIVSITDEPSLFAEKANSYQDNPAFIAHAGRGIRVPIIDDEEEGSIYNALSLAHRASNEDNWDGIVIKIQNNAKIPPLFFEKGAEIEVMMEELLSWSYSLGRTAVIIQEHVSMRDEYRFFVCNGKVVTGAGCIEQFTPMQNRGQNFDARVEGVRNSGQVREDPELVERMRVFAQLAADDFISKGMSDFFVIDVAQMNSKSCGARLGVVELNGIRNSGIYASNYDVVVEEALKSPEFFMAHPLGIL